MSATLFADGFDDAIIGLNYHEGVHRVVYNSRKMVDVLTDDDMTEEEALDYLNFNTFCAYMGEGTPLYVDIMDKEEINHYLENNNDE